MFSWSWVSCLTLSYWTTPWRRHTLWWKHGTQGLNANYWNTHTTHTHASNTLISFYQLKHIPWNWSPNRSHKRAATLTGSLIKIHTWLCVTHNYNIKDTETQSLFQSQTSNWAKVILNKTLLNTLHGLSFKTMHKCLQNVGPFEWAFKVLSWISDGMNMKLTCYISFGQALSPDKPRCSTCNKVEEVMSPNMKRKGSRQFLSRDYFHFKIWERDDQETSSKLWGRGVCVCGKK